MADARRDRRADPLPTAIEEMLRYTFTRTATKDTELGGIPVREGDRVAMYYPSANRDEAHFAAADQFDIGRSPNHHLAFGRWRHPFLPRCESGQGGGRRDRSRSALAHDGSGTHRTGRARPLDTHER